MVVVILKDLWNRNPYAFQRDIRTYTNSPSSPITKPSQFRTTPHNCKRPRFGTSLYSISNLSRRNARQQCGNSWTKTSRVPQDESRIRECESSSGSTTTPKTTFVCSLIRHCRPRYTGQIRPLCVRWPNCNSKSASFILTKYVQSKSFVFIFFLWFTSFGKSLVSEYSSLAAKIPDTRSVYHDVE